MPGGLQLHEMQWPPARGLSHLPSSLLVSLQIGGACARSKLPLPNQVLLPAGSLLAFMTSLGKTSPKLHMRVVMVVRARWERGGGYMFFPNMGFPWTFLHIEKLDLCHRQPFWLPMQGRDESPTLVICQDSEGLCLPLLCTL